MKPERTNAIRLPPGIDKPQIAVTNVLSLSGNHWFANYVITLYTIGYARLTII